MDSAREQNVFLVIPRQKGAKAEPRFVCNIYQPWVVSASLALPLPLCICPQLCRPPRLRWTPRHWHEVEHGVRSVPLLTHLHPGADTADAPKNKTMCMNAEVRAAAVSWSVFLLYTFLTCPLFCPVKSLQFLAVMRWMCVRHRRSVTGVLLVKIQLFFWLISLAPSLFLPSFHPPLRE